MKIKCTKKLSLAEHFIVFFGPNNKKRSLKKIQTSLFA
ncbi:hypothetical protein CU026_1551 [Enterococcus faecium]|nr:hypothetical protein EfmE1071_2691 [Enterococcus faecium E1071]EFF33120.1 hypothetical protein EfmE1039_0344 [Enterococcus faecium E1039]EFF34855.1 hypothetical protein EfmE1162_1299 [Enterococcus faecium E1162]MBK4750435.1 hypothetical protein [Enterococcus faecium]MBK4752582.1 hypothetical protein [Enterococcus faecium]